MSQVNFKISLKLMSMLLQQTQIAPSYDQYQETLMHLLCCPNFLRASYLDECMLMHEPVVNLQVSLDCEDNFKVYNTT